MSAPLSTKRGDREDRQGVWRRPACQPLCEGVPPLYENLLHSFEEATEVELEGVFDFNETKILPEDEL